MTRKENIVIKEGNKEIIIPTYKQKTLLDHFMILLGVICAILIFVVIFDIFYEVSAFGAIFNHEEWEQAVHLFRGEAMYPLDPDKTQWNPAASLYDDGFYLQGFWMPTFIFTLLYVGSIIGIIWLLVYYIRDYVEVVKGIFRAIKGINQGITGTVKDAFKEFEKETIETKKKNIVSGEDSDAIVTKKEKKKAGRPKKNKDLDIPDSISEDYLDRLLTAPEIEVNTGNVDLDYQPKPLFSDKE